MHHPVYHTKLHTCLMGALLIMSAAPVYAQSTPAQPTSEQSPTSSPPSQQTTTNSEQSVSTPADVPQPPTQASTPKSTEQDKKTPTDIARVTVVATPYDAQTLQMEASNTTSVLSEENLRRTAVHNVAEALGLMPGVNVVNTGQSYFGGIGGASRGEGRFTSVRGMNAEFNVNLINGVNVAQGLPYSRTVQLSLLPPSGLQTIVLNKTSLASMDGDAIGGTIDYRTPTAFDFPDKSGGSVDIGGRVESRARDYGDDGLGKSVAANYHTRLGTDGRFGLSMSGYYDTRNFVNSQLGVATAAQSDRAWAFSRLTAASGGTLPAGISPSQALMATGMYAGFSQGDTRRFGGNLSLDWRVQPGFLVYLRGTFARALTSQNSGYSQFIAAARHYAQFNPGGNYQAILDSYSVRYWYDTNPEMADLSTIQFGFDKQLGKWTLSPNIFYSTGDNNRPDHVEISARNDQYSPSARLAYGQAQLFSYAGRGYPIPMATPQMQAAISSIGDLYARRAGQLTKEYSGQDKRGIKFDTSRAFDGSVLESLQMGVKYVDSSRAFSSRNWTTDYYGGHTLLKNTGLIAENYAQAYPGLYSWPTVRLNNNALKRLIASRLTPESFTSCGSENPINAYNCNTMSGTEAVAAAYISGTLHFNTLEVLPGIRYESTQIHNVFWAQVPDQNDQEVVGHFARNHTHYQKVLPSIFLNWRPNGDSSVYRAGVWTSYTRPAFVQLGGGSITSYSKDTNRTTITQGNPDLKPISALNFDVSGEWRNDRGGYASLAGYYKRLRDYIYESGATQVNPSDYIDVSGTQIIQPENGGNGTVYGMEAAVHQVFQGMPALLQGLGMGFNLTLQKSQVDLGIAGFHKQEIQNVPEQLANATLFYDHGPISVNLNWNYSGRFISVYDYLNQGADWDNLWMQPRTRLDLNISYTFTPAWVLNLSVANITKREQYWATVGRTNKTLSDIVDSGMTGSMVLRHTF